MVARGRRIAAPTGKDEGALENVGATIGRPRTADRRPYKEKRECIRNCRGDHWSPAGGYKPPSQRHRRHAGRALGERPYRGETRPGKGEGRNDT